MRAASVVSGVVTNAQARPQIEAEAGRLGDRFTLADRRFLGRGRSRRREQAGKRH
jgi:hypothetical protein